ncbi:MAG: glycosyltransferase [Vicingaceae bacterium]|nr:glycosyltransferase [Vicingaceae bacterium]
MNSLVSIIIPCYNAEKYIAETIQSVINQTYSNWEIVVVNDGSTDNSATILNQFSEKDNRIQLINKSNSGVSDTRNKGLEVANGEFITFLDADDVWHITNLEKKVNFLISTGYDVVYSYCQLIDEYAEPIDSILKGENNLKIENFLSLKANYNTAPSGVLFKKEVLQKIGGFDVNLSNNADQDILIQVLANGFKIGVVSEVLWNYRIHAENMSKNVDLLEKDSIYLFKKCEKQQLFHSFWFKQQCFSNLYLILAGSWWKNGNNKIRGLYFLILSVINYPASIALIFEKISNEK